MSRLRLGIPPECVAAPLAWGFDRPPWSERYVLECDSAAALADRLAKRELDLALLPPHRLDAIDELVPGMSITTDGASGQARLDVRVPLAAVRTFASHAEGHAGEPLARLLFAASGSAVERVDDERAADAVLHTGDAAVVAPVADGARAIDLGEAWSSLTGLPMVWSVWVARAGFVERDTYAALHTARTRGRHDLRRVVHERVAERGGDDAAAERLLRSIEERVLYRLGNRQLAGLRAFLAEATRHGIMADVPRWRFLPLGGAGCHRVARPGEN